MKKRTTPAKGLAEARGIIGEFFDERSDLAGCREDFVAVFQEVLRCFRNNGTLFLCGNGGSFADCLHISGELVKTFERERPLPPEHARALKKEKYGKDLANELQCGFRAVPLGLSGSLVSAIWNDSDVPNIHYAQELYVMGRPGDVLLAISTSGTARNLLYAMAAARTIGVRTIGLTGPDGGDVARLADAALRLPGGSTRHVQEAHLVCYHLLCLAVEAAFFPKKQRLDQSPGSR